MPASGKTFFSAEIGRIGVVQRQALKVQKLNLYIVYNYQLICNLSYYCNNSNLNNVGELGKTVLFR